MSHHTLNNFLHHPSISNLVELYEPIRYFSRTPRTAQEKPLLSDGHFRRSVYHETSFSSDFELRETSEAYFLEGEFPGISGGTAIKVHWLDERTLRVKGIIHKTDLKTEWDAGPAENRSQDQPESPQYRRDVDDEGKGLNVLAVVQGPEQCIDSAKTPAKRLVTVKTWWNER